jgi:hypothetical protein
MRTGGNGDELRDGSEMRNENEVVLGCGVSDCGSEWNYRERSE